MDLVIASTICFLALAVVFTVIFARHISRSSDDLAIVESDDIFSPTRYRVVERLLGDADLETGKSLVDGRHIEAAISVLPDNAQYRSRVGSLQIWLERRRYYGVD
jgi:hypothetical protein